MRSMCLALVFVISLPIVAFARDKSRITIRVVKTETSSSQYTYTTPGREGSSRTNCTTTGTTNGTINDYGVGPIWTNSTGNANTDCSTRTVAAIPPQEHTGTATIVAVTAFMPDGSRLAMFCPYGEHHCDYLAPGAYTAEVKGDNLLVSVPDISGKVRTVKYRAYVIERPRTVEPSPQSVTSATSSGASDIRHLQEQAESGGPDAQILLAGHYFDGDGVPKDVARAIEWSRRSADQGNVRAQAVLGLLYSSDEIVPHDYQKSAYWWRKAADGGNAEAQHTLGSILLAGLGVPKDQTEATVWFRKSAEQGDTEGQVELGRAYLLGEGITQDRVQAAAWYRKAAEQGDAEAQLRLGALFASGQGVPQDWAESYFWIYLGTLGKQDTFKPEDVIKYRDDSASHLTNGVLRQTQERAQKWFEDHLAKPQ